MKNKYILTYCNFKILVYNLDKSLFCGNSDNAGVMEKCTGNRTILVDDEQRKMRAKGSLPKE